MKKKFIRATFVAAIAMACGINVFNAQKSETLSDIAMANVEALAEGEGEGGDITINPECKNGCLKDGDGCYCYHKYSDYKEAVWP